MKSLKEEYVEKEDEIYSNATITVYLIKKVSYIHCNRKHLPNYIIDLDKMISVTEENKKNYGIDIDLKKEIAYIKNVTYNIKYNDYMDNIELKDISIYSNNVEEIIFDAMMTNNRNIRIDVSEYGVKSYLAVEEYKKDEKEYEYKIPYDICYNKFMEIKEEAKRLASQLFINYLKNNLDYLTESRSVEHILVENYKSSYKISLITFLEFYKSEKKEIENNFSKVKRGNIYEHKNKTDRK